MNHVNMDLEKSPIYRTIVFWKNFDRVSPLYWIFLFFFVVFISGFYYESIGIFSWIGGIVLCIFLAPVIYFGVDALG